jgi:hypothetical protein
MQRILQVTATDQSEVGRLAFIRFSAINRGLRMKMSSISKLEPSVQLSKIATNRKTLLFLTKHI